MRWSSRPSRNSSSPHDRDMARRVTLPYAARSGGPASLTVRAVDGADELLIDRRIAGRARPLDLATRLLARCAEPLDEAGAAALALGDREVLLRALYAESFSSEVEARLDCPAGCGEALAVVLDLDALVLEPPDPGPLHDVGGMRLRVPTAADVGAALASPDFARALAARCGAESGALEAFAAAVERLDPNAECRIALACPACGAEADDVLLDGMELLAARLAEDGGIFRQVDRLARAYGWTEADVVALPRERRLLYVALAAEHAP